MTSNHSCPYDQGNTCYNGVTKGKQDGDVAANPRNNVPVGLIVCNPTTMKLGIASNRRSECRGEYVRPGHCTHRPVTPWESEMPRSQ